MNTDAFKAGFLAGCVQQRVTIEQLPALVKHAQTLLEVAHEKRALIGVDLGNVLTSLANAAATAGTVGLTLGAGAGAVGGHALAKLRGSDINTDEIRQRELIAAYQRQADQVRRRRAAVGRRQAPPASPRLLG